jgi:hypothetical protein
MKPSEYRKQLLSQIEQTQKPESDYQRLSRTPDRVLNLQPGAEADAPAPGGADAIPVLKNRDESVEFRVAALNEIAPTLGDHTDLFADLLAILGDATEPIELRRAVLTTLQRSTFHVQAFINMRPEYMAVLRSIIDDKDLELRHHAIDILAAEKDEYVQRRLLEGIERRSRALVPVSTAIQLLRYDVHSEYFPVLREIVAQPPSRIAKKEALRVLSADPNSVDVHAQIMQDKSEHTDVRAVSANALYALAPERFEAEARRMSLDDGEDDQIRAMSIDTLARTASSASLSADTELTQSVENLQSSTASRQVKQATRAYLSKRDS